MDFKLTYWTRRWSAYTTLQLRKLDNGWHVSHIAINGDADREGSPFIAANLQQDYVKYPQDVGSFLGFVWDQLDSGDISDDRAQEMIQEVGEWITSCETSQPLWNIWNS